MTRISDQDRFEVHQRLGVKRYARTYQRPRILLSRTYIDLALIFCDVEKPKLCEIGCGVLDICGPYALDSAIVTGYDFHESSVKFGMLQYPCAKIYCQDINTITDIDCDILVACEVLEHIDDPVLLMHNITKSTKLLVISHPINELANSGITNGEHCWSYTEDDFDNWFIQNGFTIYSKEYFDNGRLHSLIGIGEKL
jgi:2-polyprenyl-3-methyl-5-hydroxy-6-metoxy-1,4-benzoquinol methylase